MNILKIFPAAAWLMVLFLITASISSVFAQDVVVICNKNVSENVLNQIDINKIFLGKKTEWSNSQNIKFAIMKKEDIHKIFLKEYIGKTEAQFRTYWKKMVFTGKGRLPLSFDTPEEMIQYVAQTEGAVGYIPKDAADDSVKILLEK